MLFCIDTHLIHESYFKLILNTFLSTKILILLNITDKLAQNTIKKFAFHISSEPWTAEKYWVSANRSERYLNTVVNWPDSGKLHQYTTASSQHRKFIHHWTWHTRYFYWWPQFYKSPFIVNPIKCSWKIEN